MAPPFGPLPHFPLLIRQLPHQFHPLPMLLTEMGTMAPFSAISVDSSETSALSHLELTFQACLNTPTLFGDTLL